MEACSPGRRAHPALPAGATISTHFGEGWVEDLRRGAVVLRGSRAKAPVVSVVSEGSGTEHLLQLTGGEARPWGQASLRRRFDGVVVRILQWVILSGSPRFSLLVLSEYATARTEVDGFPSIELSAGRTSSAPVRKTVSHVLRSVFSQACCISDLLVQRALGYELWHTPALQA